MTEHLQSNIAVIERFLPMTIDCQENRIRVECKRSTQ